MKTLLWMLVVAAAVASVAVAMQACLREMRRASAPTGPPEGCAAQAQLSREWTRIHARPNP